MWSMATRREFENERERKEQEEEKVSYNAQLAYRECIHRRQRIAKGERINAKTALYTTETALTNKISWNRIVLHHSKTFLENHQDGDLLCTYVLHKCS